MFARDGAIRTDDEQRVIESIGSTIPFRMGEKHGDAPSCGKPANGGDPWIRGRDDPVRADAVGKGITAHGEFRCDDPRGSCVRSLGDRHFDQSSVSIHIGRNRSEVKQGDVHGLCWHRGLRVDPNFLVPVTADAALPPAFDGVDSVDRGIHGRNCACRPGRRAGACYGRSDTRAQLWFLHSS